MSRYTFNRGGEYGRGSDPRSGTAAGICPSAETAKAFGEHSLRGRRDGEGAAYDTTSGARKVGDGLLLCPAARSPSDAATPSML